MQLEVLFQEEVVLMGKRQLGLHMEAMPGGHLLNTDPDGSGTKAGMTLAPVQHAPACHRHTGHSLQVKAHRAHETRQDLSGSVWGEAEESSGAPEERRDHA